MTLLLKVFVDICLFRKNADDLPVSWFLFGLCLSAYTIGSVITLSAYVDTTALIIDQLLVDVGMILIWFGGLLYFYGRLSRFRQTLSALLGANAILYVIAIPLAFWHRALIDSSIDPQLPSFLIWFVTFWSIGINGNIIGRALEISRFGGFLLATLFFFFNVAVFGLLFAPAGST